MNKLDEKMKKLADYSYKKLYGEDIKSAPIETAIFDYNYLVPYNGKQNYKYLQSIQIMDERDVNKFDYRNNRYLNHKCFVIILNKYYTDVFGYKERKNYFAISDFITFVYKNNYIVVQSNSYNLYCLVLRDKTPIKFVASILQNKIDITEEDFNKILNLFKEFEEINGKNYSFCKYIFNINKDNIDTVFNRIDLTPKNIEYHKLHPVNINENTFRIVMGYRDDLFAPTEYFEFILDDDIKEKFKSRIMLEMNI